MSVSEMLVKLRSAKGVTQEEVSDCLGISNKTLSRWETGASSPDIQNEGFTLISLYKELPYFMLFPEPEDGFSSVLKPDKRYSELFEVFADNDTVNAFFYLFSKDAGYMFEKEVLAEKCSIAPDKIDYVIELLERYIIKSENVTVNDEVITSYSCKKHDQEFVVLFALAKTILDYIHYGYNKITQWRNKPYL